MWIGLNLPNSPVEMDLMFLDSNRGSTTEIEGRYGGLGCGKSLIE
jgi:hypothetical protein